MKLYDKLMKYREEHKMNRLKSALAKCSSTTQLFLPSRILGAKNVYLHDYVRIMPQSVIMASGGKFIMKKFSGASFNLTVVTSNHRPTVGIPNFFNNSFHINEVIKGDIIIEEDCWLGMNVSLLPGAHIGRGAVIGANTLINREIPPYAVVVGVPNRIIATKFTKEEIIEHEKELYPRDERLSEEQLDELFDKYYVGLKSIGTSDLNDTDFATYNEFKSSSHIDYHTIQ